MQIINKSSKTQNKNLSFSSITPLAEEILLERHGKKFIEKINVVKQQLPTITNSEVLNVQIRPDFFDKKVVKIQAFHDTVPESQEYSKLLSIPANSKISDFRKVIQNAADQATIKAKAVLKEIIN
ncbi:MAG: hypothetical protein A2039_04680 [Candidatus Melainabacteria bacterium GWA2_34_9]|nr:MAG: hypothetical protein A2039_04680 [Candidatus Melainabacteria bacterium GWA2_34_9]